MVWKCLLGLIRSGLHLEWKCMLVHSLKDHIDYTLGYDIVMQLVEPVSKTEIFMGELFHQYAFSWNST
jgi:hypothetical protein